MLSLLLAWSLLGSTVLHLDVLVRRGKVIQGSLGVSLDCLTTFSPTDGTDLSMLVLQRWIIIRTIRTELSNEP